MDFLKPSVPERAERRENTNCYIDSVIRIIGETSGRETEGPSFRVTVDVSWRVYIDKRRRKNPQKYLSNWTSVR